MYFNYNNKLFLGDSGIYLLSSFIAFNVLNLYNLNKQIIPEEIFIIMMVQGIDMLRLFIQRLLNKQNPFYGDKTIFIIFYKNTVTIRQYFFFLMILVPVISTFFLTYIYIFFF